MREEANVGQTMGVMGDEGYPSSGCLLMVLDGPLLGWKSRCEATGKPRES